MWHCEVCRASWLSGRVHDLQERDRRFQLPPGLNLNLLWRCAPRQGVYPHVHPLDLGVSGYLVGPRRLVFEISSVRQHLRLPGCMFPGELRWLMNEQGPVTRG